MSQILMDIIGYSVMKDKNTLYLQIAISETNLKWNAEFARLLWRIALVFCPGFELGYINTSITRVVIQ